MTYELKRVQLVWPLLSDQGHLVGLNVVKNELLFFLAYSHVQLLLVVMDKLLNVDIVCLWRLGAYSECFLQELDSLWRLGGVGWAGGSAQMDGLLG